MQHGLAADQQVQYPAGQEPGGELVFPGLEPGGLPGPMGQQLEIEGISNDAFAVQRGGYLVEAGARLDAHDLLLAWGLRGYGKKVVGLPGRKASRSQGHKHQGGKKPGQHR